MHKMVDWIMKSIFQATYCTIICQKVKFAVYFNLNIERAFELIIHIGESFNIKHNSIDV
jgi:hypothetical protein